MKKLQYIEQDLFLNERIAIVGSSARLLRRNYGSIIDSFEEVIRFNRAPFVGYEQNVGSFCSLRVVNNHVFDNVNIDDWASGQPQFFVRDLRSTKILLISPDPGPWSRRNQNTHFSCPLFKFDFSKMRTLKDLIGTTHQENLSVGATFVCLCAVSGLNPIVFGFDFDDGAERSHYWEKIGPSGNCHNQNIERQILRNLDANGMIELVV